MLEMDFDQAAVTTAAHVEFVRYLADSAFDACAHHVTRFELGSGLSVPCCLEGSCCSFGCRVRLRGVAGLLVQRARLSQTKQSFLSKCTCSAGLPRGPLAGQQHRLTSLVGQITTWRSQSIRNRVMSKAWGSWLCQLTAGRIGPSRSIPYRSRLVTNRSAEG